MVCTTRGAGSPQCSLYIKNVNIHACLAQNTHTVRMVAERNKIRHIIWEDARALEEGRERAFGARPWSPLAPLAGRWHGPPLSVEALEMTNLPTPVTPPFQGVDQCWSDWSN